MRMFINLKYKTWTLMGMKIWQKLKIPLILDSGLTQISGMKNYPYIFRRR